MWRSSRLRFHRNHGGKCRWSKNAMEATCGGRGAVLFTEFPVPTGTAFEVESWSQDPSQPVVPLVSLEISVYLYIIVLLYIYIYICKSQVANLSILLYSVVLNYSGISR